MPIIPMTNEQYTTITNTLAEIIKGTEWEGQVYLVGGCVRDSIMRHEIHDVDIAVTTPNGGILFAIWLHKHRLTAHGRRPILFEHFGTAKFRLRACPAFEIDCVQTRKGRYIYEEEPRPTENFGTIEEDALCRDLTINSLFVNISTRKLLDPTGYGMADIRAHVIRTPNNPDISLRDNAMHILRCIRFSVKYDWPLTDELIMAMQRNVDIVSEATPRRMTKELMSIMRLPDKEKAFELISRVGAMDVVEPYVEPTRQLMAQRRAEKKRKYRHEKDARRSDTRKKSGWRAKVTARHER